MCSSLLSKYGMELKVQISRKCVQKNLQLFLQNILFIFFESANIAIFFPQIFYVIPYLFKSQISYRSVSNMYVHHLAEVKTV
jgi:hypothetical protein